MSISTASAERLPVSLAQIAKALGGTVSKDQVQAPGPGHSIKDASLVVRLVPDAPDGFTVFSFAGDDWQACKDYVREKLGLPAFGIRTNNNGNIEYVYQAEDGRPYIRVTRTPNKDFYQSHWTTDGWKTGLNGRPTIPYRLPQMLASDGPVFIVEGEKDVDRLAKLGATATTSSGGGGKWHDGLNRWFSGRKVYIVPDNDDVGREHAAGVSAHLLPVARSVRIVELCGLPEKGDVSDWLDAGGTVATLLELADATPPLPANDNAKPVRLTSFTAAELQAMTFPEIKYIVEGYLTEGLTIFAGRPKIGKSWLGLDIAYSVAKGASCLGGQQCEPGSVLMLALEDNPRRLKSRLEKIVPYTFPPAWPQNLFLETEWPRANAGGLARLNSWLDQHPDARLIVIDVLAMFRPAATNKNAYEQDYNAIKSLQDIASNRNIGILVITHTRKAASESGDPFELVSGTMGLSGAADSVMVLNRDGNGTTLYCRGRDIAEIESAVTFNQLTCKWELLGEASSVRRSDERKRILSVLIESSEAMSPSKIADAAGMRRNGVDQLLKKMFQAGEVQKHGRGQYIHPDKSELGESNPLPSKKDKKIRNDDEMPLAA